MEIQRLVGYFPKKYGCDRWYQKHFDWERALYKCEVFNKRKRKEQHPQRYKIDESHTSSFSL